MMPCGLADSIHWLCITNWVSTTIITFMINGEHVRKVSVFEKKVLHGIELMFLKQFCCQLFVIL